MSYQVYIRRGKFDVHWLSRKSVGNGEYQRYWNLTRGDSNHYTRAEAKKVAGDLAREFPGDEFGIWLSNKDFVYEKKRGKNPRKRNPATEVNELVLYAENVGPSSNGHERALYNQRVSFIANLKKRVAKNQYNPVLAAKLWGYWADSAAKAYNVIHGSGTYSVKGSPFSPADRREAAKQFEHNFREEIHEGRMTNPKKKRKGRKPMSAQARRAFAARMAAARANKGSSPMSAGAEKFIRGDLRAKRARLRKEKGARATNPAHGFQIAVLRLGNVRFLAGVGLSSNRETAANFRSLAAARKAGNQIRTYIGRAGIQKVAVVSSTDSLGAIREFLTGKQ